ncbi:MAG: S8 family serine peptidase [Alphaproteobacteria bacterium]|nr:S8 family serine peptidase [Alphaproteobacteria bacterium]
MAYPNRRNTTRRMARRPSPILLGIAALSLAGCGGGSGARPSPTPAPPSAPAPTPTPTPAPTPTPTPPPTGNFNTAETRRSDGVNFHGAIRAYLAGATGQGILAGVIDDGIDEDSSEFAGRISSLSADLAGSRGINGEGTHGTNVAQILLGAKNDAGTMGIAYNANLLVLRADRPGTCATEDPANDESGCLFPESAIAAGLDRAVTAGARVVNISLGGDNGPGATLRAAVARATAAGIIVILSAGNEGDTTAGGNDPNNPGLFAQGLRDAGGGLVIIVGSVDENGVNSDFSNRAGTYAGSYLAALGEGVCCAYKNGVIETEGNFVFVISGTSFAAPQVAGAVALLAQAFPNLSSQQIVQLLYQSARDAGAAGDDAVYGQGVLDIARAFQPMGATTLAGTATAVDLGSALGILGGPMGDAGAGRSGATVGLVADGFGRAFSVDFGQSLAPRRPDFKLSSAIGGLVRQQSAASHTTALSLVTTPGAVRGDALAGLSFHDAQQARTLAVSVVTRLDARTRIGFAAGRGTSGLLAGERGESGHAMLIGDGAHDGLGFAASPGLGSMLRHDISPDHHVSILLEDGWVSGSRWQDDPLLRYRSGRDSRYQRVGAAWDARFGPARAALGGSWLRESDSLLGARLGPVFGSGGATSLVGDASLGVDLASGWRLSGAWRQMWTRLDRGGLVARGALWSSAFSFDIAKAHLFRPGDRAALRFAQPLRVARGGIDLLLPVAHDYASGQTDFGRRTYNLAPTGRELVVEASYALSLLGGDLIANSWVRRDPGHIAAMPDDKGAALRFTLGF